MGYTKQQCQEDQENRKRRCREWERDNREKVLGYRLRTYKNILERAGYTVIPPKETEDRCFK